MKIAISGKGGVGKTTLSGLMGRLLARQGKRVLLIDADPSPNLISMLDISREIEKKLVPLNCMDDLIEERTGARPGNGFGAQFRLNPKVDDLIDSLAVTGAEGVRLLVLGAMKVGGSGCYCPENVMLKAIFRRALFRDETVILDLEAGVEHLGRSTAASVDILLVVVEPGMRSLGVASQIKAMATDIGIKNFGVVLNKSRMENQDAFKDVLKQRELNLIGEIPFGETYFQADLAGVSPFKHLEEKSLLTPFEEIILKVRSWNDKLNMVS